VAQWRELFPLLILLAALSLLGETWLTRLPVANLPETKR
jgi:hypothetical protein